MFELFGRRLAVVLLALVSIGVIAVAVLPQNSHAVQQPVSFSTQAGNVRCVYLPRIATVACVSPTTGLMVSLRHDGMPAKQRIRLSSADLPRGRTLLPGQTWTGGGFHCMVGKGRGARIVACISSQSRHTFLFDGNRYQFE